MNILLYIWQLPQHILGYIFSKIWAGSLELQASPLIPPARVYIVSAGSHNRHKILSLVSGCSLGQYIFLNDRHTLTDIRHEIGHSIQSIYLGPLYLLVVGIPSVFFNNLWDQWFHKKWTVPDRIRWYYRRFPENWADTLGGVKRG